MIRSLQRHLFGLAIVAGFLAVTTGTAFAQSTSCRELIRMVKQDAYRTSNVGGVALMNSSWLLNVDYYRVDDIGVVIAKIKANEYDFYGNEYIFCGISQSSWRAFQSSGLYGSTYGEAFHEYIMPYTCNCR